MSRFSYCRNNPIRYSDPTGHAEKENNTESSFTHTINLADKLFDFAKQKVSEKVDEVLKEGEMVEVKLIDVDKKTGKLKLSRKVLLPKPEKKEKK